MLHAGDTLHHGRYLVLSQLGAGGMGAVYEAIDQELGISVALKVAYAQMGVDQAHFAREAHLLAGLDHSGLPRVINFFAEGSAQVLAMELVPGDDLEVVLQREGKPFEVARVLQWADQLLGTLEYLHTQEPPIVHRDIKPANLKLGPAGRLKLLDFGIAKQQLRGSRTTTVARAVSAAYSPIEQWTQQVTDARSDIYALGATLYQLVTAHPPVPAPDRLQGTALPSPRELNPECPASLSAAILRAMALRACDRFQSAAAFRAALQRTERLSDTLRHDLISWHERVPRWPHRRARAMMFAGLLSFLLAGGTAGAWIAGAGETVPPDGDTVMQTQVEREIAEDIGPRAQRPTEPVRVDEMPDRGTANITSVALLDDGRTAATGFGDGTIFVWRTGDGHVLYRLRGHSRMVTSLAFAADGRTLVSGSSDSSLMVWDLSDGSGRRRLEGQGGAVRSVVFAPDGTSIASGAEDGSVRLWSVGDGMLLRVLSGHAAPVTTLAFARSAETLASGSEDGTVRLWRTDNGALQRTLRGYTSDVSAIAIGDEDTLAIGSARGGTFLLHLDGAEEQVRRLEGQEGRVTALAFSPDGQTVASAAMDMTVRLWQVSTGTPLGSLEGGTSEAVALVFQSDGAWLANASGDGTVRVWQRSVWSPAAHAGD